MSIRTFARGAAALVALAVLLYLTAAPRAGALAPSSVAAAPTVTLTQVFGGFNQPLFVTHAGDGSKRLFVVEKGGKIKVVVNGQVQSTPFLDLSALVNASGSEQGLLGLAFHPSYATTGRLFVYYTASNSATGVGDNTLAAYHVSSDPNQADPASGSVLFALSDPYTNHNGGMLAFGPDGYLYVGLGDGGGGGDPLGSGQNKNTLFGKLLRLDVNSGQPYAVPPTNPFVGQSNARPEIWAYGLRNPWRFSFDRASGNLWIADVGQDSWEEVDFQPAGAAGGQNYGWNIMEGAHCYGATTCNQSGLTLPIAEYDHSLGCAITGGYLYHGSSAPSLVGAYVFGDYCSGRLWSLRQDGTGAWVRTDLLDSPLYISSFGEDEAGELYVTDLSGGGIYRLTEVGSTTPTPTPTATGAPTATATPTPSPTPTATPTGTPVPRPDLAITAFTASPTSADQPMPLSVTVINQGAADTGGSFDVHVFADLGRPPTPADTTYVAHLGFPALGPGASATVTGTMLANELTAGDHTLWALADGHDTVAESDETNNTASLAITLSTPPTPTPTATATPTATPTLTPTATATPMPAPSVGGLRLTAALSGVAAVPLGDPDGSGSARLTLNLGNSVMCFDLAVVGLQLPATAAQIHQGAAGANGDAVVSLAPPDSSGQSAGCIVVAADLIRQIRDNPSQYYVDVHTAAFPDGAVRGQLSK